MVYKKSFGSNAFDVFNYSLMFVFTLACLYPMLYVAFASFSEPELLAQHSGLLFKPLGFTFVGYEVVFKNPNILQSYLNTIFYVAVGTSVNVFLTLLGAFMLSRSNLMLKKPILMLILLTMYFDGGIIPRLLLVRGIGIYDTRLALILPSAIATWNMIVMRTAFYSLSPSLEESAKIDGANDVVVLFRVLMPLVRANMAVITLFYAVGNWNSWLSATIYLRTRELFPLQVLLREILIANSAGGNVLGDASSGEGTIPLITLIIKYCTIMVATIPILCIYPFCQRYFIKGVMLGSLKE